MDELTKLQYKAFRIIDRYIKNHKVAPTRRELMKPLRQKSTNGVNQILEALRNKGHIKLDPPRRKRNIVILSYPQRQMGLFDNEA